MLENYPDVLTVQDLTKILRMHETTVYTMLKENIIPHRRLGRSYRISKEALIDFLGKTA